VDGRAERFEFAGDVVALGAGEFLLELALEEVHYY